MTETAVSLNEKLHFCVAILEACIYIQSSYNQYVEKAPSNLFMRENKLTGTRSQVKS